MKELPKVYDPKQVEKKIYDMWMRGGYFRPEVDADKEPFCISMPPPNVTGQLHMGHALDATLQDVLTRYKRMQGFSALWLPGYDHAGIATQIKVEERDWITGIWSRSLSTRTSMSILRKTEPRTSGFSRKKRKPAIRKRTFPASTSLFCSARRRRGFRTG